VADWRRRSTENAKAGGPDWQCGASVRLGDGVLHERHGVGDIGIGGHRVLEGRRAAQERNRLSGGETQIGDAAALRRRLLAGLLRLMLDQTSLSCNRIL
jgi:hypothetical protein